jgi:uncharacterized protein YdeI (YjbR/CyaY-like superfamily)
MAKASNTELDLPMRSFKDQKSWEKWLATNHAKSPGIWMQIAKKDSGIASVDYPQALDVALCYGWIDGQKRPYNDEYWLQRFTPRGPRSLWSKINTGKVDLLIKSGRMQPPGLAAIEAAKADGRWESAYAPSSTTEVPPELQAALDEHPKAKAFFETLRGANRYAVLFRLQTAKKPETRAKRIADFIDRFERGETVYDRQKALAAARKAKATKRKR